MNKAKSVLEEYVSESKRLYFVFGGINAGMGMAPFEFYNSSRILNENKIFFRDFSQAWYQNGLPEIGKDIFDISNFIKNRIEEIRPKEVFFIGNSMGGYAAILFASIIGYGRAIAFAPQTYISPIKRIETSDNRWGKQIFNTYYKSAFKKHVWNLETWLLKNGLESKVDIFVSKNDKLDYLHAMHLSRFNLVKIYEFDVGGHRLVQHLRDEGKLADILRGTYN